MKDFCHGFTRITQIKKEILAAVKKGAAVSEIAGRHGVTTPYVYQLIAKSDIKSKKRKAA